MPTVAESAFERLRAELADVVDLRGAAFLLTWDQATMMPPGGAAARARQLALLKQLAHERFVAPSVGRLLEAAEAEVDAAGLDEHAFEADYLRVTRRDFERDRALPLDFTRRFHAHMATTYQAWTEARAADDAARVIPLLERTLDLSLELSEHLGAADHPADPLIGRSDHGFTVATLRPLFARLREALVPLARRVQACDPPDDAFTQGPYPLDQQFAFALERVREFGYDTRRGRLDATHHPFAIEFSVDDVRITTRGRVDDLREALMCTFHESGHGMYHQGIDPRLEATPLVDGTSAGVHESQSRTWENRVGRSRAYWTYAYPKLLRAFPEQLAGVSVDAFHRAMNVVRPGVIRTRADELTYDLHVIVRFELELDLLESRLAIRDLPEAWHERYREVVGVAADDDRDGVLQDVHWFSREIGGAFQGYTLGNVLAAQFWDAAERELSDLEGDIGRGAFGALAGWQRERIHRHGRRLDPLDLIADVCGGTVDPEPYLTYLADKYEGLYPEAR
ncbi:MAG: carboxypeptidase M32 [Trueperaceae bacterium]|nr:MAG: carboxypeptidase M32 [Trueperaceae bacterium]